MAGRINANQQLLALDQVKLVVINEAQGGRQEITLL